MPDVERKNKPEGIVSLSKIATILSFAVGLALIALWVYFFATDNMSLFRLRNEEGFESVSDYTCREIEDADTPIGVKKEYTFPIGRPQAQDAYLAFYTVHQYVDVYFDGRLLYSLHPSESQKISKTIGNNWVMIPLYADDAGKEVRVELTPVYESFRNWKVEFLIGSELDIYVNRLKKDAPQLGLSVAAILIGLVFVVIAAFKLLDKGYGEGLAALGIFSLMMGLWRLTDTRFTPFMFPNRPILIFYISVTLLMIGAIPLVKSMKERFNLTSCRIFDIYCIIASLICLVQLILQITGTKDLRETLIVTHLVIAASALLVLGNFVYDRLRYPGKNRNNVERKIPIICIFGVMADVLVFYIRKTSSGLIFSLSALLIYIVFIGINMLLKYNGQQKELMEKERLLAEKERMLTEQRISTMISQIQPHFIYNTLGTIEQFCMEDPHKAADLVQQFSLYLRGNFTELDNHMPISISREMDHVQHYVSIEQIRFPDMQIHYNLQAGEFMIPALTVQPLVENAIKHGLMGLESGGCVEISTYETETAYCVCVKDDGVGFEPSALEKGSEDGRKHVGIKNIRGRIEAMCGGKLIITSVPGEGTVALIEIPKEEAK